MTHPRHTGHPVTRALKRIAPLHFLAFLALLPVGFLAERALFPHAHWTDAVALAFDVAALVFLVALIPLLRDDADTMRTHAEENDANRGLILALTTLIGFAVMAAITGELPGARDGDPVAIVKLIVTLALIWLFANSIYALHYAHTWYSRDKDSGRDAGGLTFPGTKTPRYGDFAYFAFTLGMTFQTSDVEITAPGMRHIALGHCFGAFVFNIGVIAFAINALGGAAG